MLMIVLRHWTFSFMGNGGHPCDYINLEEAFLSHKAKELNSYWHSYCFLAFLLSMPIECCMLFHDLSTNGDHMLLC